MTREEKIKKAISVAVAYHIEQEKAEALQLQNSSTTSWSRTGVEMMMTKRKIVQRRGRILRSA
jgi:putative IMPACT (imprinted ancient) family translation regulator